MPSLVNFQIWDIFHEKYPKSLPKWDEYRATPSNMGHLTRFMVTYSYHYVTQATKDNMNNIDVTIWKLL